VIHRFEDGKVAETWATFDMLGLLQQLGAVELPR
jgi:predicted ester cyclase